MGTMWFPQASRLVRLLIKEIAQAPAKVREETRGWAALVANTCMERQRIVLSTVAGCS